MELERADRGREANATCPHCGKPLHVAPLVSAPDEENERDATVPFALSNHPAVVMERRSKARRPTRRA